MGLIGGRCSGFGKQSLSNGCGRALATDGDHRPSGWWETEAATGDISGRATTLCARPIRLGTIHRSWAVAPLTRRMRLGSWQDATALSVARIEVGEASNGQPAPFKELFNSRKREGWDREGSRRCKPEARKPTDPTDARDIQSTASADERRLLGGSARACTGKAIGQRLGEGPGALTKRDFLRVVDRALQATERQAIVYRTVGFPGLLGSSQRKVFQEAIGRGFKRPLL